MFMGAEQIAKMSSTCIHINEMWIVNLTTEENVFEGLYLDTGIAKYIRLRENECFTRLQTNQKRMITSINKSVRNL